MKMRRKRLSKKASKRQFRRTANKVHKKNIRRIYAKGGFDL